MEKIRNKKIALFMLPLLTQGGGAEKYFIDLAINLRIRGIETDIITMDEVFFLKFAKLLYLFAYRKWFRHIDISGRESESAVREKLGGARWIKASWKDLGKILKEYDIIYSKNELVDLFLLKMKGYKKIPSVIVGVHTPISFHRPKDFITKLHNFLYTGFLYKWLLCGTKGIHVSNRFAKNLVENKFREKSYFIYYPFSTEEILKKAKEHKSAIKFKENKCNIIFSGRLSEQKGFDILLRIISALKNKTELSENIALNIFGTGGLENEKKIKEVEENCSFVHYHGHIENNLIPEILSRHNFLISTSRWETLPFNILEAQAMGLPVIAFDIPGPADIIEDERIGFLVKNEDEFLEKIIDLVENKVILKGEDCIENIRKKFDPNKIYSDLFNMFQENL